MDDFFTVPQPPPEPPPEPRQPEWMGPPDNVLPGDVGLSLVLGRSGDAVVWMHSVLAYPQGVHFSLVVRTREPHEFDPFDPIGPPFGIGRLGGRSPDPERILKVGVELSNGRRATNLDPFPLEGGHDVDEMPDRPVLMGGGGGGGMGTWDMVQWLWPLPPPGPLTFACEWPAKGIPLVRHELDAGMFRAAAERAETLWPPSDHGDIGLAGWFNVRPLTLTDEEEEEM